MCAHIRKRLSLIEIVVLRAKGGAGRANEQLLGRDLVIVVFERTISTMDKPAATEKGFAAVAVVPASFIATVCINTAGQVDRVSGPCETVCRCGILRDN